MWYPMSQVCELGTWVTLEQILLLFAWHIYFFSSIPNTTVKKASKTSTKEDILTEGLETSMYIISTDTDGTLYVQAGISTTKIVMFVMTMHRQ